MNYKKIYGQIIERAKTRILPDGTYSETHHIVPRCMGGLDDQTNLVDLTPEEHYVCHQLLVKIYFDTEYKHKLIYAAPCMTIVNGNQQRNVSKLKWFGWLKRQLSEYLKTRDFSPETRAKMSAAKKGKPSPHKGKKQSAEVVAAKSERMAGVKKTGKTLAALQAAAAKRIGVARTDAEKANISKGKKGKPQPNVAKARMGKPSGMLGKAQSQATKDKISAVKKAKNALRRAIKEQETLLNTVAF